MKRLAFGLLGAMLLWCVYGAVSNYWAYSRMRSVPVDVVRTSLVIDAVVHDASEPPELEYTLRLDLRTTDGANRTIHWEEVPGKARYPEEALDALTLWAPGTRHSIYQLRGDAQTIRLPGGSKFQERTAGNGYVFGAVFFALAIAIVAAQLGTGLGRNLRIWHAFFLFGGGLLFLAGAFVVSRVPRILAGPNLTAAISPGADGYTTETLPPNVTVTPDGRQRLDELPWKKQRILTFVWNGQTVHGGMGFNFGSYDELQEACPAGAALCQFDVNPADRWDAEPPSGWNARFFVPLFMSLLFGGGLTLGGLYLRRERV